MPQRDYLQNLGEALFHLVGALLHAEVPGAAGALLVVAAGGNRTPNLRKVISKAMPPVQGILEKQYRESTISDKEAALSAVLATLEAIDTTDDNFRRSAMTNVNMLAYMNNHVPSRLAGTVNDPAVQPIYQAILQYFSYVLCRVAREQEEFVVQAIEELATNLEAQQLDITRAQAEVEHLGFDVQSMRRQIADSASANLLPNGSLRSISLLGSEALIDRDAELAQAADHLSRSRKATVAGPPMSGKSAFARACAYNIAPTTPKWLVDCIQPTHFTLQMHALALELQVASSVDPWETLDRILSSRESLVVVFDNIADPATYWRLQASISGAYSSYLILVPSFWIAPERQVDTVSLQLLGPGSIADIIVRAAGRGETQHYEALANALEGLPLVATQAGSVIGSTGMSPVSYYESLQTGPGDLLRRAPLSSPMRTAAAAWDAILDTIAADLHVDPLACMCIMKLWGGQTYHGALLGAISYLASDTDDLGDRALAELDLGLLRDVYLIETDHKVAGSNQLLNEYCWSKATIDQRRSSARALLRTAGLAAGSLRESHSLSTMYALGVVLTGHLAEINNLAPDLFADTVLLCAAAYHDTAMDDLSVYLLVSGIELTVESAPVGNLRMRIQLGHLWCESELPQSAEYVDWVLESLPEVEDPSLRADLYRLGALSAWVHEQYAEAIEFAELGLAYAREASNEAERTILESSTLWLCGKAQIVVGDVTNGLANLRKSVQILSSHSSFAMSLYGRQVDVAAFLLAQGVPDDELSVVPALGDPRPEGSAPDVMRPANFGAAVDLAMLSNDADSARVALAWGATPEGYDRVSPYMRAERAQHQGRVELDTDNVEGADALFDEGLAALDSLGAELNQTPKVRRLRAGLLVNKGLATTLLGDPWEGAKVARRGLKIDAQEFGEHHHEYAHDAFVLAQCLLGSWDPATDRAAEKWFTVARDIWSGEGRHKDMRQVPAIDAGLSLFRSVGDVRREQAMAVLRDRMRRIR